MSNLLKDALADAKLVKQTAMANAKAAITETFQPNLQRMISAKLAEEDEVEDDEFASDDSGFGSFEDQFSDGGEEPQAEPAPENEDDLELESLLRELDGEEEELPMEADEEDFMPMDESDDEEFQLEGEEEVSDEEIYETILRELEGEEEMPMEESTEGGGSFEKDVPVRSVNTEVRSLRKENKKLQSKLREALTVVSSLKGTINEVNLLNAKLMYNTKVARQFELNQKQKTTVLEALDRARNVHEAKLVYTTICESLNKTTKLKKSTIRENHASKSSPVIKSKMMGETYDFVSRWQQLANITKGK